MGQHVLDGAGRRGNTKNEHQGESFDITAAGWRTMIYVGAFYNYFLKHIVIKND